MIPETEHHKPDTTMSKRYEKFSVTTLGGSTILFSSEDIEEARAFAAKEADATGVAHDLHVSLATRLPDPDVAAALLKEIDAAEGGDKQCDDPDCPCHLTQHVGLSTDDFLKGLFAIRRAREASDAIIEAFKAQPSRVQPKFKELVVEYLTDGMS